MRFRKLIAAVALLSMAMTILAACGKQNTSDGSKNVYPGTSEANSITINISSEPPDMFSVTMTDTTSFTVLRHISENLVTLDENDNVKPGVAKDWTVSDDGLVYTFNLRDDMKWSNGEPVTAHDFVFAWTALLTPSFASDYAYFGYVFKNGEAYNNGEVGAEELGFKAMSDYQLEVTLENPTSYFLDTLAFGVFAPVNEKAYNEFGTAYGTDADKMVYNGPFKMTSWEHESKIVLEKNPDYYNADQIELDKIVMVMINDSNAALNSFKVGEVDMIGLNGEQVQLMKKENYPVYTYDDGSTFYLEYNMDNKYLSNKNLRKAITYAIDKQAFIDSIVKNSSQPAVSFTDPAINGLNDKFYKEVGSLQPAFDTEMAREYYNKALEELNVDSISLSLIIDDSDAAVKNGAFVQEQLKVNLGLDIKIEPMPFKSRLERMSNKDFDIVFAGWGPDYNDPLTYLDMFETGNGNNHVSYSNPEYDELLDKVRTETDKEKRFEYLKQLEQIVMDDMPVGPIYWRSRDYVLSGKIASGVIRTAFQDINLINVKLSK
ncbi:MAG TPA: peptide ABC transporter substrate-binding protein [Mobilitalea sp.]|nr:peptide ABC transporter substrate-binding protein [Mobilitalea sp.]